MMILGTHVMGVKAIDVISVQKDKSEVIKMDKEFNYTHQQEKERIFDEKGNVFLALRFLAWKKEEDASPEDYRMELRKWNTKADGSEQANKGFAFLTEQGPHNLARILVEDGYGHTGEIINGIKVREDFRQELNRALGEDDPLYDKTIDMTKLYVPGDGLFDYEEGDE